VLFKSIEFFGAGDLVAACDKFALNPRDGGFCDTSASDDADNHAKEERATGTPAYKLDRAIEGDSYV
jgi:hypothetical protein